MNLSCLTPTLIKNPSKVDLDRYITVPCGQCARCRKRRAAQWAFRLLQEHKVSLAGCSYFLTLTYDDDNLHYYDGNLSLYLPDWQNFWKKVRKRQSAVPIKYYGVGEYGGKFGRPHWHAIAFNVLQREHVRASWPKGIISFDPVNARTISYVTGYVTKPPPDLELERSGKIERTRPYMSKGLGATYVSPSIIRYHNQRLEECYVTQEGGRKIAMPRYYREKVYYPEALQRLRLNLKRMSKAQMQKAMDKFIRDFPDQDPDRWRWEYVRQAIEYDKNSQKSKRNKI